MANKNYSLAHTKWMCKYHIAFTPKFRRKEIYNQVRKDLIREQEAHDQAVDKLSVKEYKDSFSRNSSKKK